MHGKGSWWLFSFNDNGEVTLFLDILSVNGNLKMYKKGEEKMYRIDKEKKNIYNKK